MNANLDRRNFLASTAAGTTLCGWLGRVAAEAPKGPRPKSCILLWMAGGPSHLDTFDLKPDASAQVRGDFKAIDSSVPGVRISDAFSAALLAKLQHGAIVRTSMSTLRV